MKQIFKRAALAGLLLAIGSQAPVAQVPEGPSQEEVRRLVEDLDRGREAWINGATEASVMRLMTQAPDMSIFGPFGGTGAPPPGVSLAEIQRRTAAQFKGGTGSIEFVKAMSSGDLLVLVLIERSQVKFDGHATPMPWVLRSTQVFKRDGARWIRLHRHADPLIKQRSLDETLMLF